MRVACANQPVRLTEVAEAVVAAAVLASEGARGNAGVAGKRMRWDRVERSRTLADMDGRAQVTRDLRAVVSEAT